MQSLKNKVVKMLPKASNLESLSLAEMYKNAIELIGVIKTVEVYTESESHRFAEVQLATHKNYFHPATHALAKEVVTLHTVRVFGELVDVFAASQDEHKNRSCGKLKQGKWVFIQGNLSSEGVIAATAINGMDNIDTLRTHKNSVNLVGRIKEVVVHAQEYTKRFVEVKLFTESSRVNAQGKTVKKGELHTLYVFGKEIDLFLKRKQTDAPVIQRGHVLSICGEQDYCELDQHGHLVIKVQSIYKVVTSGLQKHIDMMV